MHSRIKMFAVMAAVMFTLTSMANLADAAQKVTWRDQKAMAKVSLKQLHSASVKRGAVAQWCKKNFGPINKMSAQTAERVLKLMVLHDGGYGKIGQQMARVKGQVLLQLQTQRADDMLAAFYRHAPRRYPAVPYKSVGAGTVKEIIKLNFGPFNKLTKPQAAAAAGLVDTWASATVMGPRFQLFRYMEQLEKKAAPKPRK